MPSASSIQIITGAASATRRNRCSLSRSACSLRRRSVTLRMTPMIPTMSPAALRWGPYVPTIQPERPVSSISMKRSPEETICPSSAACSSSSPGPRSVGEMSKARPPRAVRPEMPVSSSMYRFQTMRRRRAVVDDDALARPGDDLFAELVGFLELRARAPALGDVLDQALVAEQAAPRIADGADVLAHPDELAAVALPADLEVLDLALLVEQAAHPVVRLVVDVEAAEVGGHQDLARRVSEHAQQRRVRVEDLAGRRRAVEADRHALEECAIAGLGFALDPAARRVGQRRADRRDEPREVVGVLEHVVVEARLHRRDGELLAARGRAEDDRKVLVALAHLSENVEGVDPARAVVDEDDVEIGALERGLQGGGLLDFHDLGLGQAVSDRLRDQSPVPRVLVDDENPQDFARSAGARVRTAGRGGVGCHLLQVSARELCPKNGPSATRGRAVGLRKGRISRGRTSERRPCPGRVGRRCPGNCPGCTRRRSACR